MEKPSVAVGMSGGVDSSVAAALLQAQGYRVSGLTMRIWDGPSYASKGARHGCYGPSEEQDIADAEAVAARLRIPFHVIDVRDEYRTEVLEYFRKEYQLGRTPNPCSRCNRAVKFGGLIAKARKSGVMSDYFATGHYVRLIRDAASGRYALRKGVDLAKDQSYFLALLSQDQLAHSLFPLGTYTKAEVRTLAADFGLPVAKKRESQDFADPECDMLPGDSTPGPILDRQGREIGRHSGIARHTIGQRKGLGVSLGRPLYVTEIDTKRNAVIVGDRSEIFGRSLVASEVNWIALDGVDCPIVVSARIRYRHQEAIARIRPLVKGEVLVEFVEPQMAITPGQTVVFYDGDVVLGGGIIERTKE